MRTLGTALQREGKGPPGREPASPNRRAWSNGLYGPVLAASLGFLAAVLAVGPAAQARSDRNDAGHEIKITTLSSQPDRVSGGNALVEINFPEANQHRQLRVTLNETDITGTFRPGAQPNSLVGLVSGLGIGENELEVEEKGGDRASLELTDYPIQGPIVSGPHIQPFICQTQSFVLPDGTTLGPPLDADCSAATKINYVYLSTATNTFQVLPSTTSLPGDVAKTTTTTGATVNFVVRVETGTINRGIYQSAILHDPTTDPAPSPFSPPKGWNNLLIGIHGAGCPGGWYTQGASQLFLLAPIRSLLLDPRRLGQGYALYINTLQNPSNSCNPFVAGETAMMGKEHFIKTYGVPRYSLSTGCSGGSYTTLQVVDAFPRLFDGALINCTFPDALAIALSGLDGHLLTHYFTVTNSTGFTDAQQVAVSGYMGHQAWFDAANQSGRTDPVPGRVDVAGYVSAVWNAVVPVSLRYDPVTNPRGARPTIWDVSKNIFGTDPATGFALRAYDNAGIQYGLGALNAGIISKAQFLDLNQRIGGYDRDDNYVAGRTVGDAHAIIEAYKSGTNLGGGGGLATVPVFDLSGVMNDSGGYHYQWYHFATRERMLQANGNTDNHVMWRGNYDSDANDVVQEQAFGLINQWMAAVAADHSDASQSEKVIRDKPAGLVDGCWTPSIPHQFIAETQVFGSQPTTQCNALWPSFAFPRKVAGGPLAANNLKCQLKPVDFRDYAVTFTTAEAQQLQSIFPQGVCDWSRPGVNFQGVEPGISYGPAPSDLIAGDHDFDRHDLAER